MFTNDLARRIRRGECTIGSFVGLGSPAVAELLGHTGLDWLVLEAEHNAVDLYQIQAMLMATSSTSATPIVRVPSADPVFLRRCLDIGAMGVLVPMLRSADEVQNVVAMTRLPPQGNRSLSAHRASRYSLGMEDYFREANENLIVGMILETKDALDDLDAIASVKGLDFVFIGPVDLSLSLGLDPVDASGEALESVMERVVKVCRRAGVAAGMGVFGPDDIKKRQRQGFGVISCGTDYQFLARGAQDSVLAFRGA